MKKNVFNQGYTPYGYLQNPYYQCTNNFKDIRGALLRSDDDYAGFGCFFPDIKHCNRLITLGIGVILEGTPFLSRKDWEKVEYASGHHTLNLFSFRLPVGKNHLETVYYQSTQNTVKAKVQIPLSLHSLYGLSLYWIVHLKSTEPYRVMLDEGTENGLVYGHFTSPHKPAQTRFQIHLEGVDKNRLSLFSSELNKLLTENGDPSLLSDHELFVAKPFSLTRNTVSGTLQFFDSVLESDSKSKYWLGLNLDQSYNSKIREDLSFKEKTPRLSGDWSDAVKNGFTYDFETTRMCCYPPMGVFKDVWPSWMLAYPRAVLAEGSMDMNRLGYADPDLAKRAILTLFRDTGDRNVPCVFFTGAPNMVAEDGSICGTSPAWCIPFFQIFLLYLRDLDKEWLKSLYPYLTDYHLWWRENRSDEDGYIVYRCTWEAGEDDSPRLDPNRTGSGIISNYVRPVELQASMALNAHIMKFFCQELSILDEIPFWEGQKTFFRDKLQSLWDPSSQRFRDWDKEKKTFVQVTGNNDYWNADFTRLSPLSLAVVLFDLCSEDQKAAMKKEIPLYGCEPFNVWPSWNFLFSEAASALKMYRFLSHFSWQIIERVYEENDNRVLEEGKPLPGTAREYWPLSKDFFKGNDAYGWGAQTATLLIRHILGIKSSQNTQEFVLSLCPNIPDPLMLNGKTFGIDHFPYRGVRFDIRYSIASDNTLHTVLQAEKPFKMVCYSTHQMLYESDFSNHHLFILENGVEYDLQIISKGD